MAAENAPAAPVDFRQMAPDLQRRHLTDHPEEAWLISRPSVSCVQCQAYHPLIAFCPPVKGPPFP